MQFKHRESTDSLLIFKQDTGGKSIKELQRESILKGFFGVDFHFLVTRRGEVFEGRSSEVVAGHSLDMTRKALVIVLECATGQRQTDAQKVALSELKDRFLSIYPDIQVEEKE